MSIDPNGAQVGVDYGTVDSTDYSWTSYGYQLSSRPDGSIRVEAIGANKLLAERLCRWHEELAKILFSEPEESKAG